MPRFFHYSTPKRRGIRFMPLPSAQTVVYHYRRVSPFEGIPRMEETFVSIDYSKACGYCDVAPQICVVPVYVRKFLDEYIAQGCNLFITKTPYHVLYRVDSVDRGTQVYFLLGDYFLPDQIFVHPVDEIVVPFVWNVVAHCMDEEQHEILLGNQLVGLEILPLKIYSVFGKGFHFLFRIMPFKVAVFYSHGLLVGASVIIQELECLGLQNRRFSRLEAVCQKGICPDFAFHEAHLHLEFVHLRNIQQLEADFFIKCLVSRIDRSGFVGGRKFHMEMREAVVLDLSAHGVESYRNSV